MSKKNNAVSAATTFPEVKRNVSITGDHGLHDNKPQDLYGAEIEVSVDSITPNPINKKYFKEYTEEEREKLKNDIKENGLKQPVLLTSDLVLISGENRWRIHRELGYKTIRAKIATKNLSKDEIEDELLIDNIARRQISRKDKIEIIKKRYYHLIDQDNRGKDQAVNTAELISNGTGIPSSTVKGILSEIRKTLTKDEPQLFAENPAIKKIQSNVRKVVAVAMENSDLRREILASLREAIKEVKALD